MLWIDIDRDKPIPLTRQLYSEFRDKILRGEWTAGFKLPSTRKMAQELRISRNVVIEAYDQLFAEGYIESRQGSGYFVAPGIYLEQFARGTDLPQPSPGDQSEGLIDFRSGVPDLEHFPRSLWGKTVQRVCQDAPLSAFGYNRPEGRAELRDVLSRYLYRTRGVQCAPERIVMTSGATQALMLIAKVLLAPESRVLIEDPITQDIQMIFASTGARLCPVPVDACGMAMDKLSATPVNAAPSFVFVTPSHQFPLGTTLTIQRRIQLIQYARSVDCYIVEDDYDSEFRYESPPISSIQGLAPERVIYIGSFSKILSPGLRLGYLVLPEALVERYQKAKWLTDLHTPSIDQLALARFIEKGHLEKYVTRMKKLYQKRRQCLTDALRDTFGDQVAIWGEAAGLHIVAAFSHVRFTPDVVAALEAAGVRVYPVEEHTIAKGRHADKIVLGYGNVGEEKIAEGVARLEKGLALHGMHG
ncbi:PLP-dependent aminotransferase family protein [Brevibacillus agri]|uniref:MocR-like pyridoxine biosynthesis transcription factor PdxR n=1 Tax=Brevibacillus agri TaxID=51101 RepID=UPI002E23388B|nr:PLP-dependent aminotransferase family protein [Brevibacillus agri]MED1652919.1 PLP-dependent aminotransferase family protein [Brevibacillus agri]MED1687030.1 PLP-dependent aminotransferase family protein [Brevibacillus agri]MED1691768.1 PLP-dependent aminotransferase family protein [Brevibacillus agri]MED1698955.1 PLP-dependent aminotransferase family protein [Brevibacillus agri]